MIVKVGDKVLTSKYSGTEVKVDGEESAPSSARATSSQLLNNLIFQ